MFYISIVLFLQKYKLFYDIRQDYNEEADKLAVKKLQELKRSQGPPPSSPQMPKRHATVSSYDGQSVW